MNSIFTGYNAFGNDWLIGYRMCKFVGAGSKPALVPNTPAVDFCHIFCITQDDI